eukprot:TRINITY_DN6698_c0_g1_i1.p1 TRINITY_DN6698_c0_g1~~TRINITY_DN6698_c0_g1_i1.p1  ORF type:complete len:531 (+),score=116.28 TRINITY_DN6698_c0_g1_i1:42-1634(+)
MGNSEGRKYCKKLGIQSGNVIGTQQFNELWTKYDNSNTAMPKKSAIKFLKAITKSCDAEWDRLSAEQLLENLVDMDDNLTYRTFAELFVSTRKLVGLRFSDSLHKVINEETRDTLVSEKYRVYLNVYDLPNLKNLNSYTLRIGFGAFHTGIEIHGSEVSFGYPDGIFYCTPKNPPGDMRFRVQLDMGEVQYSIEYIADLIDTMSEKWNGLEYHVLENNCNHFCNDLSIRLVHHPIPGSIMKLAKFAKHFSGSLSFANTMTNTPIIEEKEDEQIRAMKGSMVDVLTNHDAEPSMLADIVEHYYDTRLPSDSPIRKEVKRLRDFDYDENTSNLKFALHPGVEIVEQTLNPFDNLDNFDKCYGNTLQSSFPDETIREEDEYLEDTVIGHVANSPPAPLFILPASCASSDFDSIIITNPDGDVNHTNNSDKPGYPSFQKTQSVRRRRSKSRDYSVLRNNYQSTQSYGTQPKRKLQEGTMGLYEFDYGRKKSRNLYEMKTSTGATVKKKRSKRAKSKDSSKWKKKRNKRFSDTRL